MGNATEILLPDIQPLAHVERFAREGAHANDHDLHRVDLWEYTCSCPDFQKKRAHYPPRDIRRGCPHILSAIPSGLLHRSPLISALVDHRDAKGVPPFEHWAQVEIHGLAVILASPPGEPQWIEVYAMKNTGAKRAYRRFLWHIPTGAWKYSDAPLHARTISDAIHDWLAP